MSDGRAVGSSSEMMLLRIALLMATPKLHGFSQRESAGREGESTYAPPMVRKKLRVPVTTARSLPGAAACAATRAAILVRNHTCHA